MADIMQDMFFDDQQSIETFAKVLETPGLRDIVFKAISATDGTPLLLSTKDRKGPGRYDAITRSGRRGRGKRKTRVNMYAPDMEPDAVLLAHEIIHHGLEHSTGDTMSPREQEDFVGYLLGDRTLSIRGSNETARTAAVNRGRKKLGLSEIELDAAKRDISATEGRFFNKERNKWERFLLWNHPESGIGPYLGDMP